MGQRVIIACPSRRKARNNMLIAAGDRYDKLVSWGAVTTSQDGVNWTDPTKPFEIRAKVTGVTHGPDRVVVVSDSGLSASAPPTIDSWTSRYIWEGEFAALGVEYAEDVNGENGRYMACGQNKFITPQGDYQSMDEAALLFSNDDGDPSRWVLIYAHDTPDSRFYNIRRISTTNIDVWIAVGSCEQKPMAMYSTDNGNQWTELEFPDLSGVKYAYDVAYTGGKFWFTANGYVLNTPSLTSPIWDASQRFVPRYGVADFSKIAANPAGHLVAVSSGGLVYTTDQISWTMVSEPGYRLKSVIWYIDRWVVGAESNLTQFTNWYSTDTINWIPDNCKVQIYDLAVV
jgi:hypothetical protein